LLAVVAEKGVFYNRGRRVLETGPTHPVIISVIIVDTLYITVVLQKTSNA
jgi:hypothetical protein